MAKTKLSHVIIVIWGTLEILLMGGLIFGWASLVFVLKQEGFFKRYCGVTHQSDLVKNGTGNNFVDATHGLLNLSLPTAIDQVNSSSVYQPMPAYENGLVSNQSHAVHHSTEITSCHLQDRHFNLIYTLATVLTGVTNFPNGFLMDKFGIRLCRCIGIVTYLSATVLAAISTPSTSMLLYPSMILLSFGGYYFVMTNFQLGNLIPRKKSTIISLYCGAYDSSAFMLVLFKFAYEGGISLRTSFIGLSFLFTMCIISTFWFIPKMRIPHPLPENYQIDLTCCGKSLHGSDSKHKNGKITGNLSIDSKNVETDVADKSEMKLLGNSERDYNNQTKEVPSFKSIVMSPLFLWDLVWLTCHRFASWSFVGRLNPAMNKLANGDTRIVGQYTSVYAALQFFGIFLAPLSGRLMDRRPKHSADTPHNEKLDKLEVCIASFVLDSTIGTLLTITLSIPVLEVQYLTFILHVIHRACLYGPNSAFIAQAFPMEHFGKLFGLAMSLAAAFSLLQFPVFVLIQGPLEGNPLLTNLFTLCLMLISYGHPAYIYWWCRRERQKDKRNASPIYKPKTPVKLEVTNGRLSGPELETHT